MSDYMFLPCLSLAILNGVCDVIEKVELATDIPKNIYNISLKMICK